jgi:hypothetical protein
MAVTVTHAKVVSTPDDGGSEVGSNEWNAAHVVTGTERTYVTGDITYYVRTDGNDSNDGLTNTANGAFLSIQKAVDTVQALDFNHNHSAQVTIQLGNGTHDGGIILGPLTNFNHEITTYPEEEAQSVLILGDRATPANVVITDTGVAQFGQTIEVTGPGWRMDGFQLNAAGSFTTGIAVGWGGFLQIATCNLNATGTSVQMLAALSGGGIELIDQTGGTNTVTFSGNAFRYLFVQGFFSMENPIIVYSGTPTIANSIIYVGKGGNAVWAPSSTTGDIVGRPYTVDLDGVLDLLGATNPSLPTGTVASRNLGNGLVYTEDVVYHGRFFYRDGQSTTATAQALRSGSGTVAQLPLGTLVGAGGRSYVIDATTTTFLSQVVGGSTYKVPVHTDGSTAWFIG